MLAVSRTGSQRAITFLIWADLALIMTIPLPSLKGKVHEFIFLTTSHNHSNNGMTI